MKLLLGALVTAAYLIGQWESVVIAVDRAHVSVCLCACVGV